MQGGKAELRPSRNLTSWLARMRGVETGYERMLTLSGRAYKNGSEG